MCCACATGKDGRLYVRDVDNDVAVERPYERVRSSVVWLVCCSEKTAVGDIEILSATG